jgi:CBS-domain-containing membrane protein
MPFRPLKWQSQKIGGLPVMQDEKLVGIVTRTDVLNYFIGLLQNGMVQEPRGRRRRETATRRTSFPSQRRRQIILKSS